MAQEDTAPKEKPDKKRKPSQKERFIEAARKADADQTGETFESTFVRIVRRRREPS